MTHTDLKQCLTTIVEDIDAPSDLVSRARQGGSRRLRRHRLTALTAAAVAIFAVAGVAVAGQDLLNRAEVASVPASDDPYRFLMNGPTRGDLATDKAYLDQAIAAWKNSHASSENQNRRIFDDLRGKPKVAWAGNTPAGPAAVVVQRSFLHKHDRISLNREGIYTLIGFIGEGPAGTPAVVADSYPDPGGVLTTAFVTGAGADKTLVVLDMGKKTGWSTRRIYAGNGTSRRELTPLKFEDGVSVMAVPPGINPAALWITSLPPKAFTDQMIGGNDWGSGSSHLWDAKEAFWPMTAGVKGSLSTAFDIFQGQLEGSAEFDTSGGRSSWFGYGKTANGSQVVIGEYAISPDPVRVYAVLVTKNGEQRIIPGGVPDKNAALPVAINLPDGQGWAVAQKDAQLSYRSERGAWSLPRANASLVPAGQDVEVKVVLRGVEKIVQLR